MLYTKLNFQIIAIKFIKIKTNNIKIFCTKIKKS